MPGKRAVKPITTVEPVTLAGGALGYEVQTGRAPILVRSTAEGLCCHYCLGRLGLDAHDCRHVAAVEDYLGEFAARPALSIDAETLDLAAAYLQDLAAGLDAARRANARVYDPLLAQAQRHALRLAETLRALLALAGA